MGIAKNSVAFTGHYEVFVTPCQGGSTLTIEGNADQLMKDDYKWLYENSGVGIGFYSLEGLVISYNLAAAKIMSGRPEDFIGQSIFDLFPKKDADLYLDRIKQAAASDQPMLYEDYVKLPTEDKWFLSTYTKIDNAEHRLLGIQIISQDITKLKLSGAELLEAKERAEKNQRLLNITGEIALVGGWEINLRLNTLVWTKQVYAIHQLDESFMPTVEDAIGFYEASSIPIIQKAVSDAIEYGTPFDVALNIVTAKGTIKDVRAIGYVQRDENNIPEYVYGTFQDISKQKEVMRELINAKVEAEKSNRAKSDFLSNMSHEIRTPLNGVFGFAQLLSEMETDAEKKEYLDIIKNSSNQLLSLINDILSLSKIEAGKMEIKERPTNLFSKIHLMADGFIKQAQLKGLAFDVEIDKCFDKNILIDHHAVIQIINNLLSNSVKFSKVGLIQLTVKPHGEKAVEILVTDTGIGISEEKQKQLFEAFEQGEYYLTKQYGGTGLGLAIVKKTVDLLCGQIVVTTELNRGTEIKVVIPFNDMDGQIGLFDANC